ncbi:peptidase M23, partial [Marivirga lumbricoides]
MLSLLVSCKVDSIFNQQSEYEKYVEALHTIELAKTALAQDWIKAGRITSENSLSVSLPYTELTRFDPANPKSVILKYTVKEGQNIQIYLQRISDDSSKVFLNAFAVGEKGMKEVAHEADSDSLKYHVEEDAEHLIRIQPELLRGGLYKIHIGFSATLAFPVPGKTFENISSYYGDARDAGRRKHEGIDIFSPRGTPVVAVMHGFVRRVSNNNLGGKVIFVSGGGYS